MSRPVAPVHLPGAEPRLAGLRPIDLRPRGHGPRQDRPLLASRALPEGRR